MKKNIINKGRLAAVMVIVVFVFSLTGCSAGNISTNSVEASNQTEKLQEAKFKLLSDWFEVLKTNESVYSYLFRMLEYTEAYGQDNSWDSLLKARASNNAALSAIDQMEMPRLNLTEEEIQLLKEAGIEINAVQREFEGLETWRANKKDTTSLFCYTLEEDVFLRASVEESIPAMAVFYREYFTLEYRYMCQFTNYLLLQVDAEEYWQQWTAQLPCMSACADVWYEKTADAEKATGKLMDEMQVLQDTQMGSLQGIAEYTLEIVKDAAESGKMEALKREINEIDGVPGYFPVPAWLPDVVNLYLVTDPDTQEKRLVKAGEELNSVPSACYISCGAVMQEDVTAYEAYLQQWGIETYATWSEAKDTWQLLANSGSSTMMIEWTEDETLLYLTEPVGCLIPELYLYAMTTQ